MVSMSPYEEEHLEYKKGAAYEIYFGVLPPSFSGSNFLDIALSVYAQHSALLIGLMTDGKHPLINPGSTYTIKGGELAIFLAPDPSVTILIKDMQNLPLSMLPPHRTRIERDKKRKALKEARKTANEKDKRRKKEIDSMRKQEERRQAHKPSHLDFDPSNEVEMEDAISDKEEPRKRDKSSKGPSSTTSHPSKLSKASDSSPSTKPLILNEGHASSSSGGLTARDSSGIDLSSTLSIGTSPVKRRKKKEPADPEVVGSGSGGSDQTTEEDVKPPRSTKPAITVTDEDDRKLAGERDSDHTEAKRGGKWKSKPDKVEDASYGDDEDEIDDDEEEIEDYEEDEPRRHGPLHTRSQITWDSEAAERNKLIRYHEVAKGVELLSRHYRVLESPRTFRSALINKAPENGHIIMTGSVMDWVYYVAPLRNRSVSRCQPVVIVTAKPLTAKQWSSIAHFPEVYMMPGASLLKRRDIERLHVQGATHILITYGHSSSPASGGRGSSGASGGEYGSGASGGPKGNFGGMGVGGAGGLASQVAASEANADEINEEDEEYASAFDEAGQDATSPSTRDTILIYSWLSRVCPKVRVIMDVRDEMDLRFLHKAEHALDAHIQQEIRSGTACATSATVERLLAQTVYNPLVLDVILQLIFGTRHASLPVPSSKDARKEKDRNSLLASSSKRSRDTVELPMGGKSKGTKKNGSRREMPWNDEDSSSDEDENDYDIKPIIRLEQIPSDLKGGSYRELFEDFVQERDALPLGLYRQLPRLNKSRKQQYVYTCPPIDTPLQPGDRVYVLFPQIPKV
jgi:hypothetical protein